MEERLETLKGIGAGRQRLLAKAGITNISSLLTYFPRGYEDRTHIYPLNALQADVVGSVRGKITYVNDRRLRPRLTLLEVIISDGTGRMKLVFFNQSYKKVEFRMGRELIAFGKMEYAYGNWQMNTPEVEFIREDEDIDLAITPVYPLVDGLKQFVIRNATAAWFAANDTLPEILPSEVASTYRRMTRYEAFKEMHFPSSLERYQQAREQLAYEELFVMQAGLALLRSQQQQGRGIAMEPPGVLVHRFETSLPFALTKDQKRAVLDIWNDMSEPVPMQRLLQGDVGSGKTVVAAMALVRCVESGYQGAMMAPTEILATQHWESLQQLCQDLPIRIALLTGSMKAAEKRKTLAQMAAGEVDIVVGTHALIQEAVTYKQLALVIVDEQHRFGVEQRATLQRKGENPHVLVMTATPIPRTMTLSFYGDLAVSTIKELPPGRQPVRTYLVDSTYQERMRDFFRKQMDEGRQVYVVCPLVEESEKLDLQAAEELYLALKEYYEPAYQVGLVHGKMAPADKDAVMSDFHQGKTQLLVSTTVIEVGVNVPNATVMCIMGAERFGLSQLHQLRGRVGRGSAASHCILVSDSKKPETRERLQLVVQTTDGFELAEQDLLLRGSGHLFGLAQHGMADLRVANIIKDLHLLVEARQDVQRFVQDYGIEEARKRWSQELANRFGDRFERIRNS